MRTWFRNFSLWRASLPAVGLFFSALALHMLPFLVVSNPLGYDTGFYRRYLIQPFLSFPNAAVPGLGSDALAPRLFFDAMRLLNLPTDLILYGGYAVLFSLFPVVVYFYIKPSLGVRGAFIAGILVAFSPVQYAAYWFMLFKNAWALLFIFLSFIAIEKGRFGWALAADIVIAASHKTSAIIYILSLAVLAILSPEKRKAALAHLSLASMCFLALNFLTPHPMLLVVPVGVFMEWAEYFGLSIAFFGALVMGWRVFGKKKIPQTLLGFSCVAFIFPIVHLPFYERVFVFSDIALAILAAYAIEGVLARQLLRPETLHGGARLLFLAVCGGIFFGTLVYEVRSLPPLMNDASIARIEQIGDAIPESATLLTTSEEAPWYEGWTHAHIAAPGMLRDTHTLLEWTAFWNATSTDARIAFLTDFPRPLYISTVGDFTDLIGASLPCLQHRSPYLLYDACQSP